MIKNKLKYMALAAALVLTASCSDVVDYSLPDRYSNNGAPEISGIYDISDSGYVNPLNKGVLNEMIRIKGANLANAKHVTFNGLEVKPSQIYAESGVSYLRIPRAIPEKVTDTLVYETNEGVAKYYFPVDIPELKLDGLANEFAYPGSRVQLEGDYFDLFGFNDTTATSTASIVIRNAEAGYEKTIHCDSCSEAYTSITIPKDCPYNSLITFSWQMMGQTKTKTIAYRMTKDLLFDFSGDVGWWNDWGKGLVQDGSDKTGPQSLGYKFLRITGTYDAWSWNSTGFGCNWSNDDAAAHPENYVLKFEIWSNTKHPFYDEGDNGPLGANKNGGYLITFNGASSRHQFDPYGQYNIRNTNGEWRTVSIPLKDVLNGFTPSGWVALELVLQPNTSDAWDVDHAFGQFRVEPANY